MKTRNEIKKYLKVRKEQLIMLAVYKKYGKEFDNVEDACSFMSKIMERNDINTWDILKTD